jgi:hypothetical protein
MNLANYEKNKRIAVSVLVVLRIRGLPGFSLSIPRNYPRSFPTALSMTLDTHREISKLEKVEALIPDLVDCS